MTDQASKKCEHCGQGFPSLRELNIHKAKSHAVKEAEKMRFLCSRCGDVLQSPEHQAEHMKSEHPEVIQRINIIFWGITIVALLFALSNLLT